MKILPICNCDDCPLYEWNDVNYSIECGLTYKQVKYKEISLDEATVELFSQCPLEEYPNMCEIKLLNAFIVHKGFAEEYIQWKGDV